MGSGIKMNILSFFGSSLVDFIMKIQIFNGSSKDQLELCNKFTGKSILKYGSRS